MTEDEYWAALKALGIMRKRRFTESRWFCSSRDEDNVYIDDPGRFSEEERVVALEAYRKRYAWFDC